MIELTTSLLGGALRSELLRPAGPGVTLYWLGQAGFVVRSGSTTLLIDPYLSDYLAGKYKGKELPHVRMMPAPIAPDELEGVGAVLCTHRHSDHMDPGTLPGIARNNPGCLFVVPAAEIDAATARGAPTGAVVPTDAGRSVTVAGVTVDAVASAHEELSVNDRGENHFLGYIVRLGGVMLYHSGDCVPYHGLAASLAGRGIDAALLPINGRSAYLRERGIAGNFTLDEAASLCRSAGIPWLLCHHHGMFDFNTVDVAAARAEASRTAEPRCLLAETGLAFVLRPSG